MKNFVDLMDDGRFWNALRNTAVYAVGVVPGQILLALFFAVVLNLRLRGRVFFRGLFFLPVLVSFAVEAITYGAICSTRTSASSPTTRVLAGLPHIQWLRDPDYAMTAVILISIWRWFGFNLVILLAGLQGISQSVL